MCDSQAPRFEETAVILSNVNAGPRLYILVVSSPRMSKLVQPGQFVHMLIPGYEAHILRRPFSILATDPQAGTMTILYQTVGQGTRFMTTLAEGLECSMLGPLGRGWDVLPGKSLVVGGGVGSAPLFMLTERLAKEGYEPEVVLGAQTESMLVTKPLYQEILGHEPVIATDDGSYGVKGFCTAPVADELAKGIYDRVYCCGPEPLMKAVAKIAADAGVECWISMEKRMACGVGACLSCVVETVDGKKRSCVDGPIFNAKDVVW